MKIDIWMMLKWMGVHSTEQAHSKKIMESPTETVRVFDERRRTHSEEIVEDAYRRKTEDRTTENTMEVCMPIRHESNGMRAGDEADNTT